jgi:hypothetical protein
MIPLGEAVSLPFITSIGLNDDNTMAGIKTREKRTYHKYPYHCQPKSRILQTRLKPICTPAILDSIGKQTAMKAMASNTASPFKNIASSINCVISCPLAEPKVLRTPNLFSAANAAGSGQVNVIYPGNNDNENGYA